MDDTTWMRRAIELARKAEGAPGKNAIGCVIVRNGEVIGEGCNEVEKRHDPTAHAEIVSMRQAGVRLASHEMRDAVLYTTLQPCGMCTMASVWAKLGRIVYGAGRDDVHPMYFEGRHLDAEHFIRDAVRGDLVLQGGVLAGECAELYVPPDAVVPEAEQVNQ
jgi:tRNA(adenine34) deaminase